MLHSDSTPWIRAWRKNGDTKHGKTSNHMICAVHNAPHALTSATVGQKTAPMFLHFRKIDILWRNDISKSSEISHDILEHVGYLPT